MERQRRHLVRCVNIEQKGLLGRLAVVPFGDRGFDERSHVIRKTLAVGMVVGGVVILAASPAIAAPADAPALNNVIDNLRNWLVGILAAVATLFLTIGGLRYMLAGGDPGQIERAKTSLRSAAYGYAFAALSPILVSILSSVVG